MKLGERQKHPSNEIWKQVERFVSNNTETQVTAKPSTMIWIRLRLELGEIYKYRHNL